MWIALLLAVVAQPTGGALAPIGKWDLDTRGRCDAVRQYGDPRAPVTVSLSVTPLDGQGHLTLSLRSSDKVRTKQPARIVLSGGKSEIQLPFSEGKYADRPNSFDATITQEQLALLFSGSAWTISELTSAPISIDAGGSGALINAMANCRKAKAADWGVDLERTADLEMPAISQANVRFFSDADYPADAVRAHQEGTTFVLWEVGSDAVARNCRVIESSGVASLDQASCRLILERARYRSPARDKNGRAIISWSTRRVAWSLSRR